MLPLVINGFMATGKSAVGRAVARKLGRPFYDLDEVVEGQAGCSIAELFRRDGEAGFRQAERHELLRILKEDGAVISVGGGALLDREFRLDVLERAQVVSLVASAEEVCRRVAGDGGRPLLGAAPEPERVRELLELRRPTYAECHRQIQTDGWSIDKVVEETCHAVRVRSVAVACGEDSYAVEVGAGVAESRLRKAALASRSHCLVSDTNVHPLYGDDAASWLGEPASVSRMILPAGEESKTVETMQRLWTQAAGLGLDRRTQVISLGGGVVSDIAGFFAATWLRGLRWGVVPTSLLAMVDASVGGKTAVDFLDMKNAVGAFWQPGFVVCDTAFLATEAARGLQSALAEAVKTALVGDPELLDLLEARAAAVLSREPQLLADVVYRCVAVKARIVSRDPREAGLRAVLNLGHTVGHALEAKTEFKRFTHGEAVSLGLVSALRVGHALGRTPAALHRRVRRVLAAFELPVDVDPSLLEGSLAFLHRDKKRVGPNIRFVVAHDVGDVRTSDLSLDSLRAALRNGGA